jgi:hypothetical protein
MIMQRLLEWVLRIVAIGCVLLLSSQSWADSNKDFDTWQNTLAPLYLWGVSIYLFTDQPAAEAYLQKHTARLKDWCINEIYA